jgi:hypothetical protein
MSRSESVSELNSELHGVATPLRPRTSFGKDSEGTPTKPFGIGTLRTCSSTIRTIKLTRLIGFSSNKCLILENS